METFVHDMSAPEDQPGPAFAFPNTEDQGPKRRKGKQGTSFLLRGPANVLELSEETLLKSP